MTMQNTDYEDYDAAPEGGASRLSRVRGAVSTFLGAIVALSLLMALGVWFYRLGVRDAQNVPIIRAAAEPAKVRPSDPGGLVTPHQDVTSYEVAEAGTASASAAVIAPAPPTPDREDVPMGALVPEKKPVVVTEPPKDEIVAALDPKPEEPAVVETPKPAPTEELVKPEADPEPAEEPAEVAALTKPEDADIDLEPTFPDATALAPAASPVAPRRPKDLRARVAAAAKEAVKDVSDLSERARVSKVQIQLAADPSEAAIKSRWNRVYSSNKDILRDRALAIQSTVSGGKTFYRLRVGPFESRSEAISVCQALKARGQDCIVARNS